MPKASRRRKPAALASRRRRARGGATVACPQCGGLSRVLATRKGHNGTVYRDRQCDDEKCGLRFWTCEETTEEVPQECTNRPESARGFRRAAGKK